ncbi:MAG: hypothetical protein JSV93_00525 [Candidatus Omnitrophota bacterium]|nr:MAG: hypothetical protein JSV93_00525 [Candidatus Omnitrophota bacterium]
MNRIRKRKLKNISNEDLFSLFKGYLKKTIAEDLKNIYEKKARLLDSQEPWVFHLDHHA